MAEEKSSDEKKIIIDEDWKTEAKKEKEKLAETQAAEKEESKQQEQNLPPGDLQALISMLAMQTLFALGLIVPQDEKDGQADHGASQSSGQGVGHCHTAQDARLLVQQVHPDQATCSSQGRALTHSGQEVTPGIRCVLAHAVMPLEERQQSCRV